MQHSGHITPLFKRKSKVKAQSTDHLCSRIYSFNSLRKGCRTGKLSLSKNNILTTPILEKRHCTCLGIITILNACIQSANGNNSWNTGALKQCVKMNYFRIFLEIISQASISQKIYPFYSQHLPGLRFLLFT